MTITLKKTDADKINALTKRVEKLKREEVEAIPYVSSQTSRSFTNSWKETEGQPIDFRRVKAFQRVVQESPIVIRDGELIVGSMTKYIRGSAPMVVKNPALILKKLNKQNFKRIRSDRKTANIEPEEERILIEDATFWDNYLPKENFETEELRRELGEDFFDLLMDKARVLANDPPVRELRLGGGTFSLRIIRDGLNSVIARAKAELEKMNSPRLPHVSPEAYRKIILLKSMIMACEAVIEFAKRHAELARNMASKESEPVRKKELLEIAERCEWVPANPPRSFAESLQSLQFLLLGLRKDAREMGAPLSRLDYYLYPYYENDLREGKITPQDAAELLACSFVKVNECEAILVSLTQIGEVVAGGAFLPHITLGGRTKDGKDATNELSYLILEVIRQLKYAEPAIYIRYHDGMKKDFLIKALVANRELGGGNPAFLNDQLGTARFIDRGVDIDDAVDWSAEGCLGYQVPHAFLSMGGSLGGGELNLAKIFEIMLYNGFDTRTKKQLGLKTGDVTGFTCLEQFIEAFEKQVDYFAEKEHKAHFIRYSIQMMQQASPPLGSIMVENCITSGLNPDEAGSARYPRVSTCMVGERGSTDVADALATIKKLVFDEKKYTMAQIMEALKDNWGAGFTPSVFSFPGGPDGAPEGAPERAPVGGPPPGAGASMPTPGTKYYDIYQACLKAPKYGNDDDYVDDIFNYISLKVQDIILGKPDQFTGEKRRLMRAAGAGHVMLGDAVGALPNGRKAYSPLNDAALSAMPGADVNGPTAVINSATKADHAWNEFGITLNMKFSRPLMDTPEKLDKMLSLLKTFFDRGGWHVQCNIVNVDELIDAKKHPEKWGNLVVRVGGYSAYFVDLPPVIQDDIIARTLHAL